ncbi:hypothetical protein [Streptomyces sp. NPDC018584]|uniref:hypothetical protein n=1 Tax=unclassified Streptomyces TaxID=2593676 RepID=UPI0037AD2EA6
MSDDEYRVAVEDGIEIPVPADGERWAVGAVILNRDGAAFAQRRGPGRRLFPDCHLPRLKENRAPVSTSSTT